MSSLARWTYTQPLTVWPVTYDQYGQVAYGTPYLLTGSWIAGGDKQSDPSGTEFTPNSTYYFEALDGAATIPQRDWFIRRGSLTGSATPPADAERIRTVKGYDMAMFGDEIPDWMVAT